MKRFFFLLVFLTSIVMPVKVSACGDSLYQVGMGVAYRFYSAPLPGSVLVYGQSEGARQLAEELAKTGHGVRLVMNQLDLSKELKSGFYDVVIAQYSAEKTIEAGGGESLSKTTFLPVAMTNEEAKQAKKDHNRVMLAEKHEIKHYLKAIHKTLKSKT